MMMKTPALSFTLSFLLAAAACAAEAPPKTYSAEEVAAESKRVNEFFDRKFDENIARHPQFASQLGIKIGYDKWEDLSDSSNAEDLAISLRNLAELKRDFKFDACDAQTQLSWRLFEHDVQLNAEGFRFRMHNYPVNQMFGWHASTPTFLMNIHRVDHVSDAEAYIARVNGVKAQAEQLIENLQTRAEKGIIPPKFVFPLVLDACRKVVQGRPFDETATDSALLADFTKKVGGLKDVDQATRDRLLADANSALTTSFRPAYEKLIAYLEAQERVAPVEGGAWQFPDGANFYEMALRRTTTTNLSADAIHDIGLKEVARIHGEMRKIMQQVKFKGDLQAMFKFMRTDPQFYLPDSDEGRAEYLRRATTIIDTMRGRLDELFTTKPKADVVVKAVEKFREKSAGKAFYQQPAPDGSRPGMFYVNLAEMKSTPTWELEGLAYHEGIPGHHMQIAIAQELSGVPKFRRMGTRFTAYSEGWGLYTELIPKEMGLYQDPYSDFGRLGLELWRAGRLVVDTALHHKRWTRQQAIDYLIKNTPNSEEDCVEAINRYIVSPSQATAYKIGMLKIVELREKAKKQLGAKFDIRQFHDVVLTSGPVPLDVLEELVNRWVKSRSAAG
ncbi:MAG TPA: DUF885 domain-containing protein [Chthoniobacterales bacterium]|nr:DUF885 domain-containing protein [Chthoniobacterales bacterium]